MKNALEQAGKSWKKLFVWLVTVLLLASADSLGLNPEQIAGLTAASGTYFVGQGIADVGKHKPTP